MTEIDLDDIIAMAAKNSLLPRANVMAPDHAAGILKAVREAAKSAESDYRANNPDATNVAVTADIHSYVKRPKEVRNYAAQMVSRFLADPTSLRLSNSKLVEDVSNATGRIVPQSLLTERLKTWQKIKVKEILDSRAIVIDLSKHDTVSKIKRALSARVQAQSATERFSGTIAFTDKSVIVGEKERVIQGQPGRIHIGPHMLSVEGLRKLLF